MNYYNEIKEQLINNEVYKRVKDYSKNRSDLNTYYNVGRLLSEAGKCYGEGIIKEYSIKLTKDLNKSYGVRNPYNMRLFYVKLSDFPKLHTLCAKLTWSHIRELLNFENIKIYYYLKLSYEQNLSVRQLKEKIILQEEDKINNFIKNPIPIKNSYNYEKITEKMLKQLILEDLDNFLTELGEGFTYIKNEYKIKLGDRYNYIDLLLFNYKYNCFVVVGLKVTELKKEHIGQIKLYMNYIDKHVRNINQDRTIGIIISKKGNEFVMEYASDDRMFDTMYTLNY